MPRCLIYPPPLKPGDTVGVVSPSSPVAGLTPQRFSRALSELRRKNLRVKVGANAQCITGHTAGSIDDRVRDIHDMFTDHRVRMIISTIGGANSNQLLEYLDYDLIRENPKILLGYSDVTALLIAVYTKASLVTYLGPAVLPQFGEYEGTHPFTWDAIASSLMSHYAIGTLESSKDWIDEYLEWDVEDNRPRKRLINSGPIVVRSGYTEGHILAGNLGTILALAGTEYWPNFNHSILFIEEDESESPASVERMIYQLRHIGVFDKISGLAVGRFRTSVGLTTNSLGGMLLRAVGDTDIPIAINFDFGHSDPMFVLPIGCFAKFEAAQNAKIAILESATRLPR